MSLPETPDTYINPDDKPWLPFTEGAEIKVLCLYPQSARFTILIRAKKGVVLPAHRHLGAAEYVVLRGVMTYRAGTVGKQAYGYEPNYALHGSTTFEEDTELFFIGHGPIQFMDDNGEPGTTLLDVATLAEMDAAAGGSTAFL